MVSGMGAYNNLGLSDNEYCYIATNDNKRY